MNDSSKFDESYSASFWPDNIPSKLRSRRQWVGWAWEIRNGKPTKIPKRGTKRYFQNADPTDPSDWISYEGAMALMQVHELAGVGFCFSEGDPYAGIDLDDCRNPKTGDLAPWAKKIVEHAGSYTEVSPSGTGVKIFGKGVCPEKHSHKHEQVEMYDARRFFTVTGNHVEGTPAEVCAIQATLNQLYKDMLKWTHPQAEPGASGPGNDLTDEEVLEVARRFEGEKFERVWNGDDVTYHSGDYSAADLYMVSKLVFYTGGDREQTDHLFRESELMRPKWDERHSADGRTYGEMTIDKALEGRGPDDYYTPGSGTSHECDKSRGPAADRLVAYAMEAGGELFVDQFGAPHVFAEGEPLPLSSRCHGWLRRLMWEKESKTVSSDALKTAAGTLAAFAENLGVVRELHTRAAWHEGVLYYELHPGRVIRVDGSGWSFEVDPPVLFRRLPNLKPLPDPEPGGSIEDLGRFVNLKGERDGRLFCAYVVTLCLPHVGRPILLATGPMGAGKSTASRVVKRLWDPTEPETIRADPRDFLQKASHGFLVMLDNQSRLSEVMSDTLCRLVTGEADSKRKLYSDDEDVIYSLRRGVLLNGINVPTERGDVLDRSLAIELERLSDAERKTEEEIWESFEATHPKLLGEAFRLLSEAIAARPRLALTRRPRLADWGYYAAGVYEALGWGADRFLEDWEEVVEVQEQATLEGSPVAQAILLFMDERREYAGRATELYRALVDVAFEHDMKIEKDKAWPGSPRWLWRRIKEVLPLLASRGVVAKRVESKAGTIIRLSTAEKAA
jgi:primase-polymerase (primpol)-like protein